MAQDNWLDEQSSLAPAPSADTSWLDKGSTLADVAGAKPSRTVGDYAKDAAAWAVKGAIGVPEALVGLADIPTGGAVGKALENQGGAFGFRPKQAREAVNEWHSDATKQAQQKFQEAEGLGGKFQAAIENPSNIVGAVVESLPSIGAGGVVARGLMGATRLGQMGAKGAAVAGALGEGATMAGSAAEQIRQETPDGLLTPGQAGAALATGALGTVFGYGGGRLAQRLGIGDADTMIAQGAKGMDKQLAQDAARAAANPLLAKEMAKGIPRQVIEGAISEGLFEELPQSVTEQVLQNLALGKDWHEDVDAAVVLGTLSGGAMGAGAAGYRGFRAGGQPLAPEQAPAAPPPADPPQAPAAPEYSARGFAPVLDANALQRAGVTQPPVLDTGRLDAALGDTPAVKPSEAMGLDPAAGPLTASAALAVDSGAADQAQTLQAAAQAAQAKPAKQKADPDTGEIAATQGQADPVAALQERLQFVQQQAQASGWNKQLIAVRNRVQRELAQLQPAPGDAGEQRAAPTLPADIADQAPEATEVVADAPARAAEQVPAAPAAPTPGDSLADQAQAIQAGPQQQEAGNPPPADRAAAPAPRAVPAAAAPAGGGGVQAAGLKGREGYDTPVRVNAKRLQEVLERTRGEPLAQKPEKLQAIRDGTAAPSGPVEVAFRDRDGALDVNDGRHRIAVAAERGEDIEVFIDGAQAARLQGTLSQPAPPDERPASAAPAQQAASQLDKKREAALARVNRPKGAFFMSERKAKAFLQDNGLADTHKLIQQNKAWHVVVKSSAPAAPTRAVRIQAALDGGGHVVGNELRQGNGLTLMKLTAEELEAVPSKARRQPPNAEQMQAAATAGTSAAPAPSAPEPVTDLHTGKPDPSNSGPMAELGGFKPGDAVEKSRADKQQEGDQITVEGLRVSVLAVRTSGGTVRSMWSVQSPENAERERRGERQLGGDSLHATKEQAIAAARAQAHTARNQARADEEKAKARKAEEDAAAAKKADAINGFAKGKAPNAAALAAQALDKLVSVRGQTLSLRNHIEAWHKAGTLQVSEMQEPRIKPMTRTAFNRASQHEQDAHEKRMKEAGNKTTYLVNDFDLGKTAHDYAAFLLARGPQAQAPGFEQAMPQEAEASRSKERPPEDGASARPATYGAKNTLVSQSRADELRAKLREKAKNHVFGGLDTEMLAWGTELAVFHLEAGVRKFADFVAAMTSDDLGLSMARMKPYLRSWYNGARDMMEDHGLSIEGMDSPEAVRAELAKIETDAAPADAAGVDVADGATTMEPRTQQPNGAPNGNPDQAGRAADQGRAPEVPERGRRDHDAAAPADSGDLEAAKPQDVPAPADARRAGGNGVRVPAADVGRAGPAGQGRDAGDGRARAGRARAPDAGAREPASVKASKEVSPANPGPGNFHLDNPLEIVGGGPVARFDKNQAAIELLNALREEGRQATTEEQRTLAGYTGWGSFGQELFQGTWERPMPKAGWEARDRWLREHLGQQEWESAQRSITNAHYTDPPTVMAMWDMVRRMGFQGGRVLEPSMGIGNFFGMMPADLKGRSQLAGIELDQLTGSMAKLLYPQANVKVMGYQESRTPDDFYDVVIGNWPFENTVIADRRYNALSPYLHDYFFLKALDQVRPGGLVVGITSNGTMDKKATRIRAALARKAELVTAIRLPSGAFQEYAGTKVVTDIVILKKRDKALGMTPDDAWINTQSVKTPAGPEVTINTFYVENPGNVIGTTDWGHGTTRMQPGMIVHRPDNMAERLRQAVELVPQDVFTREARAEHISYITNHTADREGSLTEQDGQLFVVRGEHLAPAQEVRKYAIKDAKATAKREQQLRSLIDMRRKYAALIEAERSGAADEARTALRQAFEGFVAEHGALGDSFGLDYLRKIDDPFFPALAALDVGGKPSAILRESTTRGARAIATPTPQDAYVLARNKSVDPSLSEIAQIAGKSEDEVRQALVASGAVFEAPAGGIVPSDLYLAGNVRQKLREAQTALADGNAAMQRNVDALKAVVPADVPYFNIEGQLGATWVPAGVYAEYVAHMLNRPSAAGIEATFINGRWKVRLPDGANHTAEARTGYGTAHYPFSKLVNAAFTNRTVKITRKDSDGNTYTDTEATEEANARIADIRAKFAEWLWSDPERRVALEQEYNEARNAYATPKYDGSFLAFEGMALSLGDGPFNLRQHQVNAIWRALVNRRSLNAHEVGTGKTFTMGGIAVESRRYGIAKKPVILAHNANSATVAAEILQMYPAAKVLYIDNLDKDSIAVRMRQIANDDWDAVVLPHSLIDRLSFREDTLMAMAREDIEALEGEAYEAAKDDGVEITKAMLEDDEELNKLRSVTAKELVKARNRIIETIKKQAMQSSREGAIPFEELGIDMVLVDEVHEFKKPPISTRMAMKGLNTGTSDRSIALQFVTRYIRANNFGGNVHTFTGTPITNTLTEVFHQMRYVMEDEMKAAGVGDWDGWFGSFAKEVQDVELSAAGEYEATNRLAGFVNVPELRRMVGQYMDVVFAEDMPEMQPRRVNGKTLASPDLTEAERAELLNGRTEGAKDRPYKKVINVTSDLTPEQTGIFAQLQGYARAWRNMTGKERKQAMADGAPESPIITEGLANKASFDARLMHDERHAGQEGQAEDEAGSKASKVVANVLEVYNSDPRAAQVIFSEMGYSTSTERSAGRDAAGNKIKRRVKTFATMRDVVERLVQGGIPREQIAMVTGSTSKEKRKEIALAMNDLRIRVVVGSTDTLGVGVNMQRNLRAMHHMDAPWMPGELEQRNGRGLRQGNQWNTVLEYRYMTDRLDGRRWQVLAIKQRFINAFMKAGDGVRVIEGDAASDQESDILQSFAEAAGDPRILIRAKLKKDVEALQRAERLHGNGVADARRTLRTTREAIEWNRGILKALTANDLPGRLRAMMQAQSDDFRMTVQGQAFDARKDADEAVALFLKTEMRMEQSGIEVGRYRDLTVTARWPSLSSQPELVMEVDGQEFASASLRGLEQQVRNFPQRIEKVQANIAQREAAMERLEQVAEAPFARAADLESAQKRLAALEKDIEINPVPPPAWLRAGAPMDSEAFRAGRPFVVTGHRWTADGWFVLGQDAKGEMAVPYMEVEDAQGMPLYDEREFQAPEVVEKKAKDGDGSQPAPAADTAPFGARQRSATGTPTDRAVMDMVREGRDARDILRLVAGTSKSRFNRQVARLLLKTGIKPKVLLEGGALGGKDGFTFLAKYSRANNAISLTEGAQGQAEQIILHEMVHAATLAALDRKGLHSLQMRRLFEHVKRRGGASGQYGMKNVGEFVAEAFTNPDFQRALQGMPAPVGGAIRNAWDGFVRILRSILGLPQSEHSALSRALELGVAVMRQDMALRQRGVVARGRDAQAGIDQTQTEAFKRWFGDWQNAGHVPQPVEPNRGGAQTPRDGAGAPVNGLQRPAGLDQDAARADGGRRFTFSGASGPTGADGAPVRLYHGTKDDIRAFDLAHPRRKDHGWLGEGVYLTSNLDDANQYARAKRGAAGPNLMPLYASVRNPYEATQADKQRLKQASKEAILAFTERLKARGHDGVVLWDEGGDMELVAFAPTQVKSAIGNNGNFDGADPDVTHFGTADLARVKTGALDQLHQALSHPGRVSLWDKTVGTMRHLSERMPAFKPVFEAAQRFIDDVAMLANDAADVAPRLLPRVDSWRDLGKKPISAADNKALARPLFEGTLSWGRDVDGKPALVKDLEGKYSNFPVEDKVRMLQGAGKLDAGVLRMWRGLPMEQYEAAINSRFQSQMLAAGVVWKDAELKGMFGLDERQVGLYREARAAIDRSLDVTTRTDMLRLAGAEFAALREPALDAASLDDALMLMVDTLEQEAQDDPDQRERLAGIMHGLRQRAEKAHELMERGYAPLSRFGRYTLDVVDEQGERQFFGMYESRGDANRAALQMRQAFPRAAITQGTMSQQAYQLFAGVTPESLELFGNMLGLESDGDGARDKAFQEYLRLTKNNHSALKRLIHRKGVAGYSEDVGRVLASFIYSNARQGAGGLNAGTLEGAIEAIPKQQGELKDVAMGLRSYIQDPQEEGQAIRGMLFAQYLGGSVASAFVNMTQPFAVTLPWMSQYGGMRKAAAHLTRALKDMGTRGMQYETDLARALQQAEDDGVVSPQEIHQLMAQARGAGSLRSGDGTRAGDARANAANAWEKVKVAWGQPFALAEQFNRRSTFIAAYRLAKERGDRQPAEFARRAVLETQFLYSKANKPKWARGAVGGTIFTFKTYSVSYLELLQRMWTQGGPEGKRAVAWAGAMLLLMGGAGGLPFMEDVEDLIDGIGQLMGYNMSVKQKRQQLLRDVLGKELADFVEQGASGLPGAPVDVSGRLGLGNLIPGTGLLLTKQNRERDLLEIAGPAGDLVARGFTSARKVLTGDVAGAALEVSPTAVRNAAKGVDMAASGIYKDTKGYKVLDTTLAEAAAKAAGFQPKSVAEVQEANSFMQRSKSFYIQTSSEIKAAWADALFNKDERALERVKGRLQTWNRDNPEQPITVRMPDVWKSVREMNKDRTQRIADTAPKALRQQMRDMARAAAPL